VSSPSQTVGPFYDFALTANEQLGRMAGPDAKGDRVLLRLTLFDGDGVPVPDGMIELWQADAGGKYDHPNDAQEKLLDPAFCGFGRLATDANGVCQFETIHPGPVPGEGGAQQAPHINVSIFARGLLDRVVTRVYFAGDPALDADPVLALVPADRRQTLIAQPDPMHSGQWNLDIRLQGECETVFFDI